MKSTRVAACLVAVLAVAGCSTPSGSTAFRVDGTTVTESQVDDTAKACAQFGTHSASDIRAAVATYMLRGALVPAAARRAHVTVSDAAIEKAVAASGAGELMKDPTCAAMVRGQSAFHALATQLGAARMARVLKTVPVTSNPAYGTYDYRQAAFDGSTGSLSRLDEGSGKVFGN